MNHIARRKTMKKTSKQVGGTHYELLNIEPVEVFVHYKMDWFQSEILKYCSRFLNKNGKQDLDKAYQVADMAIEFGLGQLELFHIIDAFAIEYSSQFEYASTMGEILSALLLHDYVKVKQLINKLIEKYYG